MAYCGRYGSWSSSTIGGDDARYSRYGVCGYSSWPTSSTGGVAAWCSSHEGQQQGGYEGYGYKMFDEKPQPSSGYDHGVATRGECGYSSATHPGSYTYGQRTVSEMHQPERGVRDHAHQVFDVIASLQGRVLAVVMHQVKQQITVDILNRVFSAYGLVEKIFQSSNQFGPKVLIQYKHGNMANQALRALHGWYLYRTHCQLDIRHAYTAELQSLYEYSCALISEVNNDVGELRHEAAMSTVQVNDKLNYVSSQMKGLNSEQRELLKKMHEEVQNLLEEMKKVRKEMEQEAQRKREQEEVQKELEHFLYNAFDLFEEVSEIKVVLKKGNNNIQVAHDRSFDGSHRSVDGAFTITSKVTKKPLKVSLHSLISISSPAEHSFKNILAKELKNEELNTAAISLPQKATCCEQLLLRHSGVGTMVIQLSKENGGILNGAINEFFLMNEVSIFPDEALMYRSEQSVLSHWDFRKTSLHDFNLYGKNEQLPWYPGTQGSLVMNLLLLLYSGNNCAGHLIPWDPGNHRTGLTGLLPLLKSVIVGDRSTLPWDPGDLHLMQFVGYMWSCTHVASRGQVTLLYVRFQAARISAIPPKPPDHQLVSNGEISEIQLLGRRFDMHRIISQALEKLLNHKLMCVTRLRQWHHDHKGLRNVLIILPFQSLCWYCLVVQYVMEVMNVPEESYYMLIPRSVILILSGANGTLGVFVKIVSMFHYYALRTKDEGTSASATIITSGRASDKVLGITTLKRNITVQPTCFNLIDTQLFLVIDDLQNYSPIYGLSRRQFTQDDLQFLRIFDLCKSASHCRAIATFSFTYQDYMFGSYAHSKHAAIYYQSLYLLIHELQSGYFPTVVQWFKQKPNSQITSYLGMVSRTKAAVYTLHHSTTPIANMILVGSSSRMLQILGVNCDYLVLANEVLAEHEEPYGNLFDGAPYLSGTEKFIFRIQDSDVIIIDCPIQMNSTSFGWKLSMKKKAHMQWDPSIAIYLCSLQDLELLTARSNFHWSRFGAATGTVNVGIKLWLITYQPP